MKKIKSYTSIWNVEKVIYSINDLQLPFPITFTQVTWFVVSILFIILFSHMPPFSFIDGAFLKYLGLPVAFTWFMSQKTFDGKKPYGFLKSILSYFFRSRLTYAYEPIKLKSQKLNESITIVRSELYEVSD